MRKERNLVIDKDYQVFLDSNDENLVYAVNKKDKEKISELFMKHSKLENIPDEHTFEFYKVVKLRDKDNRIEDWGIKDDNSTYKLSVNKLKYPVIFSRNT